MKDFIRPVACFLTVLFFIGCTRPVFRSKWAKVISPPIFTARFETSKGNFDVEINRELSPKAADRFFQLLNHHFYNNTLFYRVVPDFVVQFGNTDTAITGKWVKIKVPDEKVINSNKKGTLSFARGGQETRGNDLFINLKDNQQLDTINYENVIGFPAFGIVKQGMEVVESIYSGYGDRTMDKLDTLYLSRSRFLNIFPKLDSIRKAYLLKTK